MKNASIFFLFLAIIFAGCGKNEQASQEDKQFSSILIGDWYVASKSLVRVDGKPLSDIDQGALAQQSKMSSDMGYRFTVDGEHIGSVGFPEEGQGTFLSAKKYQVLNRILIISDPDNPENKEEVLLTSVEKDRVVYRGTEYLDPAKEYYFEITLVRYNPGDYQKLAPVVESDSI